MSVCFSAFGDRWLLQGPSLLAVQQSLLSNVVLCYERVYQSVSSQGASGDVRDDALSISPAVTVSWCYCDGGDRDRYSGRDTVIPDMILSLCRIIHWTRRRCHSESCTESLTCPLTSGLTECCQASWGTPVQVCRHRSVRTHVVYGSTWQWMEMVWKDMKWSSMMFCSDMILLWFQCPYLVLDLALVFNTSVDLVLSFALESADCGWVW